MNIDPMGELLMSHSPYAYAFNNPVYFDDPTGMLPGIDPSQLYNLIEDVNFLIDMSQSNIILDEVVVSANTSSSNNNWYNNWFNEQLLQIWGIGPGLQGNGQTGSGVSIDYDDFTPRLGGAKTANAFARFLRWVVDSFTTSKNMNEVSERIAPTKKPNESTMDNKVDEESKNVPEKIIDTVTYQVRFYSNYKNRRLWLTVKGKDSANVLSKNKFFGWLGYSADSVSVVPKYNK